MKNSVKALGDEEEEKIQAPEDDGHDAQHLVSHPELHGFPARSADDTIPYLSRVLWRSRKRGRFSHHRIDINGRMFVRTSVVEFLL